MARAQADPRFATPPLPLERLKLRRRLLREKITGLITAIDALLQDPAPHVTDLTAKIYRFHDTPIELRSLDAAIQGHLTGDKLKEDVVSSQHFDEKMRSCQTRLLLHPVGTAAMNSAAGEYVRTTWRSDNRERMGVPIVPQNTHFVSLPMVKIETRQKQLENTMNDEHAANTSSSIWMAPCDSAVNATLGKSSVTKPCAVEAEDLTQAQMTVPICPPTTSLVVFQDSERMLLSSDRNETQGDDKADAFLPSTSATDEHAVTPPREAYPRTKQINELSDPGLSKHSGLRCQHKLSPRDATLRMHLDHAPKILEVAHLKSRREEASRRPPSRRKMSTHALRHVVNRGDRVRVKHQFQRVRRCLLGSIPSHVLKLRLAYRFRIWRLHRSYPIRNSAESPPPRLHRLRARACGQRTNNIYAGLLVFVAAAVICTPTNHCSFRNVLVIKTHIDVQRLIGVPYDPGGYPNPYGVKRVILMHKEQTRHHMRIIAPSIARANSPFLSGRGVCCK